MWGVTALGSKGCRLEAALIAVLIMLGGCVKTPVSPQVSYIGWHCEEVKGSREPQCEQRQFVNGRPVAKAGDVDAETEQKQVSIKSPVSQKPREIIPMGEHRPRSWREQLPGFTLDKPGETAGPEPSAYRDGPAPVPEAAFTEDKGGDIVDTEAKPSNALADNDNMAAASAVVSSEPLMKANPDDNIIQNPLSLRAASAEVQRQKGVTVQLGAFTSEEAAQQFIRTKHLAHLTIERQVLKEADQWWHILTFGEFSDKESAGKAWLAAADNAEEIEVWIRPVKR